MGLIEDKVSGAAGCTSYGHFESTLFTRRGGGVFAERRWESRFRDLKQVAGDLCR